MSINTTGLTTAEAEQRTKEGKINTDQKRLTKTNDEIIRSHVFTYFNLINTVLFVLVLITGKPANGLFYMTVLFNTFIGVYQEIKARRVLDRLQLLVQSKLPVLRDGTWDELATDRIVLGDVVRLSSGNQVPADAVILNGYLEVNEAILTGESLSVQKNTGDTILAGTVITSGSAEAEIIHVGKDNYSASIMKDARRYKPSVSVLRQDIQKLLKVISVVIIPVGFILFVSQYRLPDLSWQDAVLKSISAVVGMIPEGLVVLTSVALVSSMIRLAGNHVLVKDMYSIESLARVDMICLDKTGTLTQGKMKVEHVVPFKDADMSRIRQIMGSYVRVFKEGNATDEALADYFEENTGYEASDILPFSSSRKYSAVSFGEEGSFYFGAYEFLFLKENPELKKAIRQYTMQGNRVLILAHSSNSVITGNIPADLEALCLVILRDVLRVKTREIIRYFVRQGITIKVMSGDDPRTVSAIATEAGIPGADKYTDMSYHRLKDYSTTVMTKNIFGRVLPEQKKAMISALQNQGYTVAMVGDGVNDVQALKEADVSIAMAAGTQAARDSAEIVLLESDFSVMPGILNEGRRVINNISRASSMYLVKTIFSVLLSVYVILTSQDYPFLPVHLTLISAFGVGIPTFLLQMEPSFEHVNRKFLAKAFRDALPTAIVVFFSALLVDSLKLSFTLNQEREMTVLLILTVYAYLFTLYRVYYPPDRFRIFVISGMGLGVLSGIVLLSPVLKTSIYFLDLLIIVPGMLLVPVMIAAISGILDLLTKHYRIWKRKWSRK